MNLIDKTLKQLKTMSADDVIQAMGHIYDEPVDRDSLPAYPQYIRDIVFLIDLDTELAMQGIGGLLGNSTCTHIPNMVTALKNIQADNEADIPQEIYERYKTNPDDKTIDELSSRFYLYTGFDIWPLSEAYVDREMRIE